MRAHGDINKELNMKYCRGCTLRETALANWRRNVRWRSLGKLDGKIVYICAACGVAGDYKLTKADRVKHKEHIARIRALQKNLSICKIE
jgi:RNase P subunit RPR2